MVNIAKVIQGLLTGFFGILISITTYYWIPELITSVTANGTLSTTIQGIMWMGLILMWIMMIIIVPGILIVQGIQET